MDGKRLVGFGLLIMIVVTGVFQWKEAAVLEAGGDLNETNIEIAALNNEINDLKIRKSAAIEEEVEKKLGEVIDEKEEELTELKKELKERNAELKSEGVDRLSCVWFWTMVRWAGLVVLGIGLMQLAATGSDYEKLGSLVALGLIVARMLG